MPPSTQHSLPGACILLFAILIWILFLSIYLSNPRSRINRWCFFAGMSFSMGVFKEFLYFSAAPYLLERFPGISAIAGHDVFTQVYSVMTAILYYLSMPCVMMLSLYYSGADRKMTADAFRRLRLLFFTPCLLFGLLVPYWETRSYQLGSTPYYLAVSAYNWTYGIIITVLFVHTLYHERLRYNFRQRKMVAVNVLLPMWYWLVTAFLFHSLRLTFLFKAWQGNLFIILFLLAYYLYNVFHDGIWGVRLKQEHYDWMSEIQLMERNTAYVEHALKNELIKIDWCTDAMASHFDTPPKELQIIRNSTDHLKEFLTKSRLLSAEPVLNITLFPVLPVLKQCTAGLISPEDSRIRFEVICPPDAFIACDKEHLVEVLNNILNNAVEVLAGRPDGLIQIHYGRYPVRGCCVLSVADNGPGMEKKERMQVFRPYYTTKSGSACHYGLGLYYCYQVMDKLKGHIRVRSVPGKGTTFALYFPMPRKQSPISFKSG